ncbi:MAG TPA: hypothetical protein VMR90_10180 [Candidatus Cybelea sp.]|nr:hypothetical protein [Candidatus Cybelea sp.]
MTSLLTIHSGARLDRVGFLVVQILVVLRFCIEPKKRRLEDIDSV